MRRALDAADLEAAHQAGEPAIVADVEGLDFLDGKLERLEEAHQRGIRHVQLVHYTPNDIGDFQTGAVTHHGLTAFGAEVIRACHRLGFVCDVAHATEDMVKQAVKVATKPLLLSHTAVAGSRAMGPTPLAGRQVSPDHARAIAETGGSVGIWHFFPSLDKYVDGLKEMADIVGVDHVSIGTDQLDARGSVAGLRAMGAPRRGDAARRLHRRGGRQDRRRQLHAHLPRRGRLRRAGLSTCGLRVAFGDPGLHLVVIVGEIVFGDVVGGGGPDAVMPEDVAQRLVEMLGGVRPADIVRVQ